MNTSERLKNLIARFVLKYNYWGVQEKVSDALKKITGRDFGEDYEKWFVWWSKNKQKK